jgi:hypothetical protein
MKYDVQWRIYYDTKSLQLILKTDKSFELKESITLEVFAF